MEIERVTEQVATITAPASSSATQKSTSGFDEVLRAMLEGKEEVNEEELYNMLVSEELPSDLKENFNSMYQEKLNSGRRGDGYSSVEDATNQALKALYDEGLISEDEKMSVMSSAFSGAQLDDNLGALYDGRGSDNDPTTAVATAEEAIIRALSNFENPTATPSDSTISSGSGVATKANANDGQDGFLWKPQSDSTGNLVVLLPTEQRGNVLEANIHDSLGNLIEKGVFSGDDHNGNRPHYRFSEPGASYGEDLIVKVTLASGEQLEYSIPNGAERVD